MARIVRPPSVKLTHPPLRAPTLHRRRLYTKLDDALRHGVTLITGDAGFGKSTLVAGYLAERPRPAVWYRLDGADSDPGIFAAALLEGAKPFVPPRVYRSARRSLGVVSDWAAVAPVIAGVLDVLPADLCIILDGGRRRMRTLMARLMVAFLVLGVTLTASAQAVPADLRRHSAAGSVHRRRRAGPVPRALRRCGRGAILLTDPGRLQGSAPALRWSGSAIRSIAIDLGHR